MSVGLVGVSCHGLMVLVVGIGMASSSFGHHLSWSSILCCPLSDVVLVHCRLGVGMEG